MASIKRRRGKYHVVYYYLNEDGEKKQKWESFDTEAEAKHRKAEIEYKQGSRTFIAPSKTTVAAFLEDFVSLYANPDLRGVQAPAEPAPALDVQSIILQLQQSPELLSALTSLISNQGCK